MFIGAYFPLSAKKLSDWQKVSNQWHCMINRKLLLKYDTDDKKGEAL